MSSASSSSSSSSTDTQQVRVMSGPLALERVVRCGKYKLVAKLGQGGMAEVYLAVAEGIGGFTKLLVVKRIRVELMEEPEFVHMFLDEARLAAKLSHPNVVQTHEVSDEGGVPFIAMEYLEGQSYHELRRAHKRLKESPLPRAHAVYVCLEALRALHYAHELTDYDGTPLEVVHRDVSPSNLFITHQGVVKLLDFGIAKATSQLHETRTGQVKGKFSYMAPEQASGREVDRRADVWGMGVMLWEAVAGRRLFKESTDVQTIRRVLSGDVPDLAEVAPDAPEELQRIVGKALTVDPDERYATAQQMADDLEEWLGHRENRITSADLAGIVNDMFGDRLAQRRTQVNQVIAEAQQREAQEDVTGVRATAQQNRRKQFIAAAMVLLLAGAGAAAAVYLPSGGEEGLAQNEGMAAANAPDEVADEGATEEAEPDDEEPESDTEEAAGAGDEGEEAGSDEEEEEEEEVDQQSPEARRAAWRARQRRLAARRRATAQQQESDDQADKGDSNEGSGTGDGSDDRRGGGEEETANQPKGHGLLSLDTLPWSEVFINGRSLGVTPLVRERVPAGTHTLTLRNQEQDISMRYRLTVEPDGHTVKRLGLE